MTAATVSGTRTGKERTVEATSSFAAGYELVSGDPSSEVEAYSVVQLMLCTQCKVIVKCGLCQHKS